MKNYKKIAKIVVISIILVLVAIGILFYLVEQDDKKKAEVTFARQELSRKLADFCTTTPEQCPKNTNELEIFAPNLYKSSSRYSLPKYSYDSSNGQWQLVVNFNGTQVAVHNSTSEYVVTGELYSLEAAKEQGLYP